MINFKIIEIPDSEIITDDPSCIMNAFKYMVEIEDTGIRWFGSNSYDECVDYINQHKIIS